MQWNASISVDLLSNLSLEVASSELVDLKMKSLIMLGSLAEGIIYRVKHQSLGHIGKDRGYLLVGR